MSEKINPNDFIMVEVLTPMGDPSFISKTAFDAEVAETDGLNCWSPNPNTTQTPTTTGGEKNLSKRPISEHILAVLAQHPDKSPNFKELQQLLADAGYKHSPAMVRDNLNILVKDCKICKTTTTVEEKEVVCFGVTAKPVEAA